MSDKDGGPAFARPAGDYNGTKNGNGANRGMSLRDYFAAKALAALIVYPTKDGENCGAKAVPKLAKWAYEYADAMLEARQS
jgi:hypothetical protein